MLKEDIREGQCRNSLHKYSQVFGELAEVDGMVVRGEQLVIPKGYGHMLSRWHMRGTWARTKLWHC